MFTAALLPYKQLESTYSSRFCLHKSWYIHTMNHSRAPAMKTVKHRIGQIFWSDLYRKDKRLDGCVCIGIKHFNKSIFKKVLTKISLWGFAGGRGNVYFPVYTLCTIWIVSTDRQKIAWWLRVSCLSSCSFASKVILGSPTSLCLSFITCKMEVYSGNLLSVYYMADTGDTFSSVEYCSFTTLIHWEPTMCQILFGVLETQHETKHEKPCLHRAYVLVGKARNKQSKLQSTLESGRFTGENKTENGIGMTFQQKLEGD